MFELETLTEPSHRTRPRERPSPPLPRIAVVILAVMFSLGLTATYLSATAQETATTRPLLMRVSSSVIAPEIVVSGANFTPGGSVFIAIYEEPAVASADAPAASGTFTPPRTRWTTASDHTLADGSSHDPNRGFHPGGVVYETFALAADQRITVRAFDAATGIWSDPLDFDTERGA